MCAEGQLEGMKVQSYHEWFRAGVAHWLDIAVYKALKRIDRAVEFDTLQAVDNSVQYSSSAVDTLTIFYQIKVFWTQLAWPDIEGSYTFIAKIIDVSPKAKSNTVTNRLRQNGWQLPLTASSPIQNPKTSSQLVHFFANATYRYSRHKTYSRNKLETTILNTPSNIAYMINNPRTTNTKRTQSPTQHTNTINT